MQEKTDINTTPGGCVKKITRVFEHGERFIEIDGEKFALLETCHKWHDEKLVACDITIRQLITPKSIEVMVKL